MGKLILLIAGTVVGINLIYILLPNGNFEKFSRHILGLVLILVFAGTVLKLDISSEVLNFSNSVPVYNTEKIQEVLNGQTEKMVEEKIVQELTLKGISVNNVKADIYDNTLKNVKIVGGSSKTDEIKNVVSRFCGIDEEFVVVE